MTTPTTRTVMGMSVPLAMVPRIVASMRARYPEATAGITDPDAIFRAATRAWVTETWATYEEEAALKPLDVTIANTVTEFESRAKAAKAKALEDAAQIVDDVPEVP